MVLLIILFLVFIAIPFTVVMSPFDYLGNRKFEKEYKQFLETIEGENFFIYNNRKKALDFIQNEVLGKLPSKIKVFYLDGRKLENEQKGEYYSVMIKRLNNYTKFPHLMKVRNGKVVDVSINQELFNWKNQGKNSNQFFELVDVFFELKETFKELEKRRKMRTKIIEALRKLEEEKNIRILYACETGSRAWGFASEDSDYDVRFIYVHDTSWYLSLDEKPDTISIMLEERELDLVGWELRKTLRLMKKSNASLFEKLDSPEVYINDDYFDKGIKSYVSEAFSPIAVMYHYLSMCKNVFSEVENKEKYTLKMLFYSLRTALASKWVQDKNTIPPMVFNTMVKELDFDAKLKERIALLLELKSAVDEKYLHDGEADLINFVRETIDLCNLEAKNLDSAKNKNVKMNLFFRVNLESEDVRLMALKNLEY